MQKIVTFMFVLLLLGTTAFAEFFMDGDGSDWAGIPATIMAPDNTPGSYPADVKAAVTDIVDVKEVRAVIEDDVLYTQIKFWGGPAWPNSAYVQERDGVMSVRHRGYYHLALDFDNDPTTGVNMFYYEAHYTTAGFLASLNDPNIVVDPVGAEGAVMWGCDYEWSPIESDTPPVVKYIAYEWYDWSQNNWEIDDDRTMMIVGCEPENPDTTKARSWIGIAPIAGSEVDIFKDDSTSHFVAGHGWGFDFIEMAMDLRPFKAFFGEANFTPGAIFGITPMIETPIDDWAVDVTTRGEVMYPGAAEEKMVMLDGSEDDWANVPAAIMAPNNTPGSYPADVKAAVSDVVDVKEVKAVIEDNVLYTQIKFWGGPAWPNSAYVEERDGVLSVRHRGYYHLAIDLDNDPTTGVNMFYYEAHYTTAGFLASLNDPNIVVDPLGAEAAIMWGCDYQWAPADESVPYDVKYIAYEWYDWSQNNWEIDDDRTATIAAVEAPNPDNDKAMMWYGKMPLAGSDVELYKNADDVFFAGHAWGFDYIELGMELTPLIEFFGDDLFQPGAVFGIAPMIETPIDDWAVDVTTRGEVAFPGEAVAGSFMMDGLETDWEKIAATINAPDNTPGSYPADVKAAVNDVVDVKEVKAVIEDDILYTQIKFWGGPAWPNNAYVQERDGVMSVRHRGYYHLAIDLDNDPTTGVNMFFYEAHYTTAGFLASLNDPNIVVDPIGAEAAVMWGSDYQWAPLDGSVPYQVKYIAYEWYDWSQNNWEIDDDRTATIAGVGVENTTNARAMKNSGYMRIAGSDVEMFKNDSTSFFYAGHGWGFDFIELAMDLKPLKAYFGEGYFQSGAIFGIAPMIETPIDDWAVDVTTRGEVAYPGAAVNRPFDMDGKENDWADVPVAINAPDNTPGSYPADVKAAVTDVVDVKEVKASVQDNVIYAQIRFWGGPAWPNNAYVQERDGVMSVRHRGYYHLAIDLDNDPTTGVNMFFYEAHYTTAGFLASLNDPNIPIDPLGAEAAIMWGCDYQWAPLDESVPYQVKYVAYEWYDWSQNNWEIDDDRTATIAGVGVENTTNAVALKNSGYMKIAGSDVELFKNDSTSFFYAGHGWGYDFLELAMELTPLSMYFGDENFQPGKVWGIAPMIETPIDDWAVDVTTRGEVTVGAATGVDSKAAVVDQFRLYENYPNPFNPTTTIQFDMPQHSNVKLSVYNMLGQRVRTLVDKNMNAGSHVVTWDGTNEFGQQVSSGVYLYRIEGDFGVYVKKMTLMK